MLSFSKLKALLFVVCILFCLAFVLASLAVISQGQPTNIVFLAMTSSLITASCAAIFGLDLIKESKTMLATVHTINGVPVDITSLDVEDVHILSLKQKLDRRKLNTRELVAHIIHYYEQRKTLGFIKKTTLLQINFQEAPNQEYISEINDVDSELSAENNT